MVETSFCTRSARWASIRRASRASAIAAGLGQAIISNQRVPSRTSWKTIVRLLDGAGLKVIWSMCVGRTR